MDAKTPMTRDVIVVIPELPLSAAWRLMGRKRIRHLPVVRAGTLLGILSDRDVLARARRTPEGELEVPDDPVGAAMTPSPITCEPTTSVSELARVMTERKIDALPVVDGERLVGLVTSTDLLLLLIDLDRAHPLPFDYRVQQYDSSAPI
jgi:acetoin utilization protein AcuB